jgi:adenine phosphoribosyltransferase
MDLKTAIRDVPDFPVKGILFRDITPLLAQADALKEVVDRLAGLFRDARIGKVMGVESRGFMFGAPLAIRLGAGFVPVRKPGKLPSKTIRETYELEYGHATLELHEDALRPGDRVLVVDDLIATGGTLEAAVRLAKRLGAEVVAAAVVIELTALGGRRRLPGLRFESLVKY